MGYNSKYTIEDKMRLLNEQKNSGMTAKEWCVKNDVAYGSFKCFSQTIRDHNFSNAPQLKKSTEKKKSRGIAWISSPAIASHSKVKVADVKDHVQGVHSGLIVQCMIEIGIFKIHVPENIKPNSLRVLVEVLKQCS